MQFVRVLNRRSVHIADIVTETVAESIADTTGGPCKSRIFGGRGYPRASNPRVTSNVLVLKP